MGDDEQIKRRGNLENRIEHRIVHIVTHVFRMDFDAGYAGVRNPLQFSRNVLKSGIHTPQCGQTVRVKRICLHGKIVYVYGLLRIGGDIADYRPIHTPLVHPGEKSGNRTVGQGQGIDPRRQ